MYGSAQVDAIDWFLAGSWAQFSLRRWPSTHSVLEVSPQGQLPPSPSKPHSLLGGRNAGTWHSSRVQGYDFQFSVVIGGCVAQRGVGTES